MKNKFKIIKIDWLDKETMEASVTFFANNKEYQFFSHPCHFKEGYIDSIELSGLIFDDIKIQILEDKIVNCFLETKDSDNWAYNGIGEVTSLSPLIIDFNGIQIDFEDEIEKEKLSIGMHIELEIGRLDGSKLP